MKIGALTSKPYAFVARPWELKSVVSLDFFDLALNPIIFSIRGLEVLRVLPMHSKTEFYWISDKTRYFYDALKNQRVINSFSLTEDKEIVSFTGLLSIYVSSILGLWTYHPYDRRYHEISEINFGDELPIPLEVVAGYPGIDNKSRIDFFNHNILSVRDFINLFNIYWYWHPWLPFAGNSDFRHMFFSSLDNINEKTSCFFVKDFQFTFPSLFLKLKKKQSLNFALGFSLRQEGFFTLDFALSKLLNFKDKVYLSLFDNQSFSYIYFMD